MRDHYAVIGNPIAQSKSPLLHTAFAQQTGQDMVYTAILGEIGQFAAAVRAFAREGGRGLNVTMPFKLEAFELANTLTERARMAQAVNTLVLGADGQVLGDNTDGVGLVRDITQNLQFSLTGKRILLLGAGGAVRGTLLPLLGEAPKEIFIANRTAARAQALAEQFSHYAANTTLHGAGFADIAGQFDLILNGSASSMTDEVPPIPAQAWCAQTLAYDMAYKKEPSAFLRLAQSMGAARSVDGLGMLVEQGAESFFLWRGVRPDTAPVLRQLRVL